MNEEIEKKIIRETARKEMRAHQDQITLLVVKRQEIQDRIDGLKKLWRKAADRFHENAEAETDEAKQ